jgi:hypothetical protein
LATGAGPGIERDILERESSDCEPDTGTDVPSGDGGDTETNSVSTSISALVSSPAGIEWDIDIERESSGIVW